MDFASCFDSTPAVIYPQADCFAEADTYYIKFPENCKEFP